MNILRHYDHTVPVKFGNGMRIRKALRRVAIEHQGKTFAVDCEHQRIDSPHCDRLRDTFAVYGPVPDGIDEDEVNAALDAEYGEDGGANPHYAGRLCEWEVL